MNKTSQLPGMQSTSRSSIPAVLVLIILITIACSPALLVPTAADATAKNVPLEALVNGRNLYAAKCGSCHSLHTPQKRTQTEWASAMDKMWKKAKLTEDERSQIMRFLNAYSRN